jgi:hypothetical protein
VIRVVPRVERGEAINAGVVLHCRQRSFLGARVRLDEVKLAALDPTTPAATVDAYLDAIVRVAEGDPLAGPIARLDASERFGWLAAPSSTIIQPSPIHTGLCEDPQATLDALFSALVA